MILKPLFRKFRNSEIVQFFADVLGICKQQKAETLQLAVQTNNLSKESTRLSAIFKITQGSSFTDKVIELDHRRDDYIIGIRKYAEALIYHFEQATQDAAVAIVASFDKYGKKIYKLNYEAETITVTSLAKDWTADTVLAAAIVKLNLTAWVEELKTSNNLFNEVYLTRTGENATKEDIKFIELRKSSITYFRELVTHIESRATIAGDASYDPLIRALNVLIQKYNLVAASHTDKDDKTTPPKG
ncbi:MAG TPA: DUF6261 family protein [Bacteroidales bacterium]